MDESIENGTSDVARPTPPRWKGIQSLDLVYQFNERCIQLLREVAAADAHLTTLPMISENRDLWARMAPELLRAASRMPFVVSDAQFMNATWWSRVTGGQSGDDGPNELLNGLPLETSEHLMHETTMFAWQTARWDRTVAQMSLAMSPSVVAIVAGLTPQQIRAISTREKRAVRIRWAADAQFWRDLLMAAEARNNERMAALHLHAKLLLCGELAQLQCDHAD